MEDLYKAGFKRDDVLGALRILPFVGLPSAPLLSTISC